MYIVHALSDMECCQASHLSGKGVGVADLQQRLETAEARALQKIRKTNGRVKCNIKCRPVAVTFFQAELQRLCDNEQFEEARFCWLTACGYIVFVKAEALDCTIQALKEMISKECPEAPCAVSVFGGLFAIIIVQMCLLAFSELWTSWFLDSGTERPTYVMSCMCLFRPSTSKQQAVYRTENKQTGYGGVRELVRAGNPEALNEHPHFLDLRSAGV